MTDLRLSGWHSAKDRLPTGKCLAIQQISKRQEIIIAFYAKSLEIEATNEYGDLDYDDDGDSYLKEGWYENLVNDPENFCNVIIDGEITHWRPLPDITGERYD